MDDATEHVPQSPPSTDVDLDSTNAPIRVDASALGVPGRRGAVADDSPAHAALRSFPAERSEHDLDVIYQYLTHMKPHCRRFFNLRASRSNLRYLCKHLMLLTPSRGTLVYKQGEVGDKFYVIVEGVCEVFHAPIAMTEDAATSLARLSETGGAGVMVTTPEERRSLGCRVGVLPAGECFGESTIGARRDSSVVCTGHTVNNVVMPAKILQVDGKAYRRCIRAMFQDVQTMMKRRVARLQKMHLFQGWPDREFRFFAYWMKEVRFAPGTTIYSHGDQVKFVYFLAKGAVNFKIDCDKAKNYTVELVQAPSYFGELEVVDRVECRQHTVVVTDDAPAIMAAIPVNVFWRLMLSELPSVAYEVPEKLEKLAAARHSWHQLRVDDYEDSGEVKYTLLSEIQYRFLGCPWCGEKTHVPSDCPTLEVANKQAGGAAATAKPVVVAAAAPVPPVPIDTGSPVVTPRTPRTPVGTPRTPIGTPRSTAGTPRMGGTPRSRRSAGSGPVNGDDWNAAESKRAGGAAGGDVASRLDPKAKLFLQEAQADIRSVMKAVLAFKRLVARRRAERAAAATPSSAAATASASPAAATPSSAVAMPKRIKPTSAANLSKFAATKAARQAAAAAAAAAVAAPVPATRVTITPIHHNVNDIISGSLPRPTSRPGTPNIRKSKSVSDINPLPTTSPTHGRLRRTRTVSGDGMSIAAPFVADRKPIVRLADTSSATPIGLSLRKTKSTTTMLQNKHLRVGATGSLRHSASAHRLKPMAAGTRKPTGMLQRSR